MRIPSWILAAVVCAGSTANLTAEETDDRTAAVRKSVETAIGYLQDRGETWKDSRQCASCHHVTLMTWAMHEAKRHDIAVDDELLKTSTDWLFEEADPAKVFQRPTMAGEEYTNPLSMTSVYAALAESSDPNEANYRVAVTRILKEMGEAQEADGSWKPFFGRAPIFGSREALTLWLTNVSSWPNQPEELKALVAEPRKKALDWLKTHADDTETQVLALRLWMHAAAGETPQSAALTDKLITLQREDGGWSQVASRASDAYATAHVLYAFQIAGVDQNHASLRRGVDYLLQTQAKDGSWPMISRENPPILVHAVYAVTFKDVLIRQEPPVESTSRNSEPISFIASAWATVALSRTLP